MKTDFVRVHALRAGVAFAACLAAATSIVHAADPWAPPAGYYSGATGAGATLKSQLYDIMRTGHIQRTYGNFRSSAVIHDADPNAPGNILLVYNRASVSGVWDSGVTWNREHVWPQSLQPGSASNSSTGNLGDPHALRPANPSINSSRGNKPFGLDDTTGNHGSLGSYYFPGDADKGDIARNLFYSDTRWGPVDGISLTDSLPGTDQMGDLSSLIVWHYADPPDAFERRRNHTIYSQAHNPSYYTNNRNAYVDHPEFVWSVYMDQSNDSQLFVGGAGDGGGASSTTVEVGPVLVGGPANVHSSVAIDRSGFDGVYFNVAVSGDAASANEGGFNAFPVNATGSDSMLIDVGIETASTAVPGVFGGTVTIDNLDVTTGAGAGLGANDADDTINVELTVLDHAEASFDSLVDQDFLMYDFGVIEKGSGAAMHVADVFNLEQTPGLTAPLDVVVGSGSGDTTALTVGPAEVLGIAPQSSGALTLQLSDAVVGVFSASYTIEVFDDQSLAGSIAGASLTIVLDGEVVSGCEADLNGDDVVDGADLASLLSQWGGAGTADINSDGTVDGADLAAMLAAWGACPGA